jgi:hypothetical protein
MQLAMMTAAERYSELVSDFETERSRLSKPQVMRIGCACGMYHSLYGRSAAGADDRKIADPKSICRLDIKTLTLLTAVGLPLSPMSLMPKRRLPMCKARSLVWWIMRCRSEDL